MKRFEHAMALGMREFYFLKRDLNDAVAQLGRAHYEMECLNDEIHTLRAEVNSAKEKEANMRHAFEDLREKWSPIIERACFLEKYLRSDKFTEETTVLISDVLGRLS